MLFNSYEFIFAFLPLTFMLYFYLNYQKKYQLSKLFLVASSLFFYAWWNVIYLPLILLSMLFNYRFSKILAKEENHNKIILLIGIAINLALLGYFKYYDFFMVNVNLLLGSEITLLHLALPLAISFFTFQQISYLVDAYRKEVKEDNFLNYALFVTFFPQLIAGPIVHHKEMMPQFSNAKNSHMNLKNISLGVFIFSIGLFKKVVIADTFAVWATKGFDMAETLNLFAAWFTSLSYTIQLYFDFSGYTDMAIGIALLFNIKLPSNFNSPYKALDIQDFWRRWHITLSRFLRDYIYIPLGGSRKGEVITYANLMITFLLGGIWHGAGWTFVFWGFLHGMALVVHRVWKKLGFKLWTWLAWFITFNFINISWVFFKAKEWDDAIKILSSMFSLNNVVLPRLLESKLGFLADKGVEFGFFYWYMEILIWMPMVLLILLYCKNSLQKAETFSLNLQTALFTGFILTAGIISLNKVSEFLYFNF